MCTIQNIYKMFSILMFLICIFIYLLLPTYSFILEGRRCPIVVGFITVFVPITTNAEILEKLALNTITFFNWFLLNWEATNAIRCLLIINVRYYIYLSCLMDATWAWMWWYIDDIVWRSWFRPTLFSLCQASCNATRPNRILKHIWAVNETSTLLLVCFCILYIAVLLPFVVVI